MQFAIASICPSRLGLKNQIQKLLSPFSRLLEALERNGRLFRSISIRSVNGVPKECAYGSFMFSLRALLDRVDLLNEGFPHYSIINDDE